LDIIWNSLQNQRQYINDPEYIKKHFHLKMEKWASIISISAKKKNHFITVLIQCRKRNQTGLLHMLTQRQKGQFKAAVLSKEKNKI